MSFRPQVTVSQGSYKAEKELLGSLNALKRRQVYVGVPSTTAQDRTAQVAKLMGKKARKTEQINNAQLVFIHTNGSPLRHIPARPIIEPAIEDKENAASICEELKLAATAALEGKPEEVTRQLKRAGLDAQNRVRAWFTNPKNHWAPNAASTIRRKGSDKPLIDTGSMRKAITYVVSEE
jgi:hypothetical protein